MSVPITVGGVVIQFPTASNSPQWGPAVTQFAQAVAGQLTSVSGPFDVTTQTYTMISNANSNVNIPNLVFSTSNVSAAFIRYSVSRATNSVTLDEAGLINVSYNPTNGSGQKWEITREYVGDAQITFTITDAGQIQFSTVAISGIDYVGSIEYAAQALLQS